MTTNPLPATAAWYAKEMDWAIFRLAPRSKVPLKGSNGFKDATKDLQVIGKLWKEHPTCNIGCATGDVSGLLVVDVDDPESFKSLCAGRDLPVSTRQVTSPGRMQLFFKMPKDISIGCSASKLAKGVDVRVNGGYTVVPPSIHPDTGRPYDWVEGFELPAVGLADAPGWLLAEIQSLSKESEAPAPLQANGDIPEGQRNDTLFRYGAALRAGGASREEVLSSIRDRNHARCKPPLDDAELIKIAESAVRYDPMAHLTDMGNAERFVKRHGASLKYCTPQKKWYIWDEKRWVPDRLKRVELLAKEVVRSIPAEAEGLSSEDQQKAIRKWARQSESADRIRAMVRVAQSDLAVAQDAFDTHPWLLNVENGTLDLKTVKLLPHNRDHLITRLVNGAWSDGAECPTFLTFLDQTFPQDTATIEFLQRAVGLSLIGKQIERALFILLGRGANGKSVLIETLMDVFGDYTLSTPAETFLAKNSSNIPNDVARLKGARIVTCRETEKDQDLAASNIKMLTGNDMVPARYLYGEWFQFRPVCTCWLATNHAPEEGKIDDALWDRLKVIDFKVQIPEEEQDRDLRDKLLAERDAILRWAVEGCAKYLREGLELTIEMRNEMWKKRTSGASVEEFIREACYQSISNRCGVKELYEAYERYWEEIRAVEKSKSPKTRPMSYAAFSHVLKDRGHEKKRSGPTGCYEWWGLAPIPYDR